MIKIKPNAPAIFWIPALLTSLLVLVPILYLVMRASQGGERFWDYLLRERTVNIAWNTIRLAAGVSIAALAISLPLAWLTTRTDLPFRRLWDTLAALPLVIASYIGAVAVIGFLSPRGLLQRWLEPLGIDRLPSIYGYFGAWATLTLFTYPYLYLSVRAGLRGLDPSLEEASRGLGRGPIRTFFTCTIPQLRPSIGAGGLLVALYAISDFSVVTLMRYDAFTRTIYTQYRSAFDRSLAAGLSIIVVLMALFVLVAEARIRSRAAYFRIGSGAQRIAPPVRLGRWKWLGLAYCATISILALGIPVTTLLYWLFTGSSGEGALNDLSESAVNSLKVGLLSAALTIAASIPIAVLAVRYRSRLSLIVERIAYFGYAIPGIVIALSFVYVGARYVTPLYQTLTLLVIVMAIRHLPQGVGATRASLLQINPRLEEASRSLGHTPLRTMTRVTIPLIWPGLAAGASLVFLTVMRDIPVTLLLRPTGFDTLATEIWTATGIGAYGRAAGPALVAIAISAIPTLFLSMRSDRSLDSVGH
jgi:iron(III) transport system permease protein